MKRHARWLRTTKRYLREHIGPGIITGASDDDPSGIATYSQAGARYGFGMLWTVLFVFPFMSVIQEISGRIGRVTGKGIAANLRQHYPHKFLVFCVTLLLCANILNIGADLGAMGAAVELLTGFPSLPAVAAFAALSVCLAVFIPYKKYIPILQWLVLVLFAYVATAFIANVPWKVALRSTFIPSLSLTRESLGMLIAILGTTISPYLFFWQSSQEVEEIRAHRFLHALLRQLPGAEKELWKLRLDTILGMGFSSVIAFFIILTTAVTLHAQGVTDIQTAADAAAALRPIAGPFASLLFAVGIVGTGLLAIPVLAASAAFAVGEAFRWPVGLERQLLKAKGFYGVFAAATFIGLFMNLFGIDPIKALIGAAVVNGIVSVPLMVMIMLMGSSSRVMGPFVISPFLKIMGWIATLLVGTACIGFVIMIW